MTEESTTPDLAELSRQVADAMSSRDVDLMMSFFATDAVMLGATGTQNGAAAIRELWEGWLGAFEELHIEVDELLDLGNGVSFAVLSRWPDQGAAAASFDNGSALRP